MSDPQARVDLAAWGGRVLCQRHGHVEGFESVTPDGEEDCKLQSADCNLQFREREKEDAVISRAP
jgi:hypothetical protein